MNRNSLITAVLIISFGTIVSSCVKDADKYPGPVKKITLGTAVTSMLPALVHVAKAKGFFLEYGIDMDVIAYPTGKHALAGTLKGEVNMATAADSPIVFKSFVQNDFSIFGTIVDSEKHMKALARKDRNIHTPQDLTGKKVATTKGTVAHFFMDLFFVINDMDYSKIKVENLKPKEMVAAITNGDVDAIFAWEPNIIKSQKILGDKAIILSEDIVCMATFSMVARNEYIQNNPNIIKRVLKALRKAEAFTKSSRKESVDILASYLKTDRESIDKLWDSYNYRLTLSQSLLITFEDEARWAINNQLTDKTEVPNYLNYIYVDALNEINPDAVTIIH